MPVEEYLELEENSTVKHEYIDVRIPIAAFYEDVDI